MPVTLKKLALEAGVSIATASLALNGSKEVSPQTTVRLQSLARKYDYHPNQIARTLAGGASMLVGVLIDSLAPPVQFRLLAIIEKLLSQHGYKTMIGEVHDDVEQSYVLCQTFRQYGVDGLLVLSHDYPQQEKRFQALFRNSPNTIFIGRPRLSQASYIDIDRSEAIHEALLTLSKNGYQRTGLLCESSAFLSGQSKISAFLKTQRQLGVSAPESLICHLDSRTEFSYQEELLREWILTGAIDSLLLQNDIHAAKLCKFLQRKGISIPEDFGLVGADNDSLCQYCSPELSSIDDALDLQAFHAVKLLMENTKEKQPRITQIVKVRSKFIPRESSSRIQGK